MRNRLSHLGDLGEWEVARRYGFVYELSPVLEDEKRVLAAQENMDRVLLHYSLGEHHGCSWDPPAEVLADEGEPRTTVAADGAVMPSESVMVRAGAEETPLVGATRLSRCRGGPVGTGPWSRWMSCGGRSVRGWRAVPSRRSWVSRGQSPFRG